MKVIVKSNEYIAIPTDSKSNCLYQLGQYLNKENCEIKMEGDAVKQIICKIPQEKGNHNWYHTVIIQTEIPYKAKYIILDLEGNLVDVVTQEQFDNKYAILAENKENK